MVSTPAVPPATTLPPAVVEYDVELVAVPFPPAAIPKKPGAQRSLLDMDRRDFIMLGAGIFGTLGAVLAAVGLYKIANKKPPEPKEGDK
jgi:hypothetical protein